MTARYALMSALAALAIAGPGMAEEAEGAFLLPQVVVPERGGSAIGTGSDDTAGGKAAGTFMLEEIRRQIGDRYVMNVDLDEAQSERLNLLLSGGYLSDYTSEGSGVSFSTGRFAPTPSAAGDAVAGLETLDDVAGFAMTPANIRAMALMTPEQIDAIALMAEINRNPQADLSALIAAGRVAQVGPHSAPRDAAPPMQIGDGSNLALSGWYAAEHDGVVYIENDQFLGSRVGVELGSVIGAFGPVMAIERGVGGVDVVFASGDRIAALGGSDMPSTNGIPALGGALEDPDMDAATSALTDIIMSDPVPAGGTARGDRPLPRPDRITSTESAPGPSIGVEG